VYLAKKGDDYFACKVIQKSNVKTKEALASLQVEVDILQKTLKSGSGNVIKLIEMSETYNNFYMVMELCNGGDLYKLLELRKRFTENEARFMLS